MAAPAVDAAYLAQIDEARRQLRALADGGLAPKFVRLAAHDALTYDAASRTGGANGSIRTERELGHPGNEGLGEAVQEIESLKAGHCSLVTHADLIALAGVVSIEAMGGPQVPFTGGRRDSRVSPPAGRLPAPSSPHQALARAGLPPRLAAALVGFHPLGLLADEPLQLESGWQAARSAFDNTYFRALASPSGAPVAAGAALLADPALAKFVQVYARDAGAWRDAYAEAFAALITLGTPLASGSSGSAGGGGRRAAAAPPPTTLTHTQLAAGVAVVAAAGAALGYWLGRRRRMRTRF